VSDPVAAVDALLDRLETAAPGARWSVFLLDHGRLWAVAHRGSTTLPDGLPLDSCVLARALREERVQVVADVAADPTSTAGPGMVAEIVVPVRSGGTVVGVLDLQTPFPLPERAADELGAVGALLAAPLATLRDSPAVDLSSLVRLLVHMSSVRDAGAIAELAARSFARVLELDVAHVLVPEVGDDEVAASWSRSGAASPLPRELVERLRTRVDHSSVFDVVDTVEAGLTELATGLRTLVWLPLRVNGIEVGVLIGGAAGPVRFCRRQAESAALLAAQAAGSLDAALALVRERRTASTDPLTGLLNRRGFGDRLEVELAAAAAERRSLSLLVLDCDDFKAVNDRGGHERGDRVLAEIGALIASRLTPASAAGRLGGDEFAVMLPDTDPGAAHVQADELRVALARGLADAGTNLHLSIGVATYPFDGPAGTQLLRAADQALYVAKASGKDLVVAFRDLAEWLRRGDAGRAQERRARSRTVGVAETAAVAEALAAETNLESVLHVLCRSLTSGLAATASQVSRLDGDRLFDVAKYALRDVDLGASAAYLVGDFPLTVEVLELREARTMSFVDDRIDRAEAFVLRELGMNSLLMLPVVVAGAVWGLVEVYDVRMRQFDDEDVTAAQQLTSLAARRLTELAVEGRLGDRRADGVPLQRPMRGDASSELGVRTGA
jgi:diguanylate cyclase (GGDEF)-like protein